MDTAEPAITVKDLTIGWDDVVLMKNVSFEVPKGDTFVILGGSGCGKSTLLRHLIGLETAQSGEIEISGIGAPDLNIAQAPQYGVMFQGGALFGSLTLVDNVELPLRKWTDLDARAIRAIATARLGLVALAGFENHLPAELSGGMIKRGAIARALALEPSLLFLDEPSAGLDPISAVELDDLLLTLNERLGVTIVMVTHELDSIFKVGKHCIMLDKERQGIIARGDPRELKKTDKDPVVHSFFNREVREK
jgi:phospholipid/cholesterol/gamma-HCH transport system ATP-binding protein